LSGSKRAAGYGGQQGGGQTHLKNGASCAGVKRS
jgi:hypothetical protein